MFLQVLKRPFALQLLHFVTHGDTIWHGLVFQRHHHIIFKESCIMDQQKTTEIEAAVFRRLLAHLDANKDVQNIELMNFTECLSEK